MRRQTNRESVAQLKARSVSGGLYTVFAQGTRFGSQLASAFILSRLLEPEDFGLVAIVVGAIGLFVTLHESGASIAVIQLPKLNSRVLDSLFWANLGFVAVLVVIAAAISPLAGWFYGDETVCRLMLVLSVPLLLPGFTNIHRGILRRRLELRSLAVVEVAANLLALSTSVFVAFASRSVWALVALHAIRSTVTSIGIVVISGYCPRKLRWHPAASKSIRFSMHLVKFNLIRYLGRNLDTLLIGYVFGPQALGYYNRAYSILMLPISQVNVPVSAIALPVLSRLADRPKEYTKALGVFSSAIGFAGLFVVGWSLAITPALVSLLLGEGWEPVVTLFRCLSLAAFFGALGAIPGWVFLSHGRARDQLKIAMITFPLLLVFLGAGCIWGVKGVALGYSLSYAIAWLFGMNAAICGSPAIPGRKALLGSIAAPACANSVAASVTLLSSQSESILIGTLIYSISFVSLVFCVRPLRFQFLQILRLVWKHWRGEEGIK